FAGAGHESATVVTDVMLSRLVGVALINKPFTATSRSLRDARSNSSIPISLNSLLPTVAAGAAGGGAAAVARVITTGSVAPLSVHASAARRRHPVTRTTSTRPAGSCAAATAELIASVAAVPNFLIPILIPVAI